MPRNDPPRHQHGRAGAQGSQPDSATSCGAPYHFVPVKPELAVTDAPVFHDVQQTDQDYWSGELRCTLEALTPLIAGNYQFEYQNLADEVKARYQALLADRGIQDEPKAEKKIIEPLCQGAVPGLPGPILIAGEALKGMVRQSLQALLCAPMERVQERTFSFRPNPGTDATNMVPAIVHSRRFRESRLIAMEIEYTGTWDETIYVTPNSIRSLQGWLAKNGYPEARADLNNLPENAPRAVINAVLNGLYINRYKRFAPKLERQSNRDQNPADLLGYALVRYRGGLDGQSTFATAFNKPRPTHFYEWALVPLINKEPTLVPIPLEVLANYSDTLDHLGDDVAGHLLAHPQKKDLGSVRDRTMPAFQKNCPRVGDLIFVERVDGKIVGIGHHFRHRRRYRDTVHLSHDPDKRRSALPCGLREILCPRPLETMRQSAGPHTGAPQQLSTARLLFGYVGGDRDEYDRDRPNEPLTFGIGERESDFKQLAGRISFNWAVEQISPDRSNRFLNEEGQYGCLVPLRPLGAPKPSAVETYLTQDQLGERQDQGTLCTYGDTVDDLAAGELRGRKFYLHQSDAATTPEIYELRDRNQRDWASADKPHLVGDQAIIARFVSAPGTTFRFTLRFRDLRSWELGALLFTLTADQPLVEGLVDNLKMRESASGLNRWLDLIPKWKVDDLHPLLALKLGHGRPLGLGSVCVQVNDVCRLCFDADGIPSLQKMDVNEVRRKVIAKLADKLGQGQTPGDVGRWIEEVLLPWLQVHRYAGRKRFDYPRGRDGLIYNAHTDERRRHAKGRKLKKGQLAPRLGGLKSLDELDAENQ